MLVQNALSIRHGALRGGVPLLRHVMESAGYGVLQGAGRRITTLAPEPLKRVMVDNYANPDWGVAENSDGGICTVYDAAVGWLSLAGQFPTAYAPRAQRPP